MTNQNKNQGDLKSKCCNAPYMASLSPQEVKDVIQEAFKAGAEAAIEAIGLRQSLNTIHGGGNGRRILFGMVDKSDAFLNSLNSNQQRNE